MPNKMPLSLWAPPLLTTVTFVILAIGFGYTLGAPGIALANGLAYTGEAVLLWYLLNRRFSGVVAVRSTLVRVIPVAIVCGLLVFGLLQLTCTNLRSCSLE